MPYEILEHTADVGIRATAPTLEGCFEEATLGLAEIAGVHRPGRGEEVAIELEAPDVGALLVDWLSEVLYLHDARDAAIAGARVAEVSGERVRGTVMLAPRGDSPGEGTQVKAITYHRLAVDRTPDGYVAEVYVDV